MRILVCGGRDFCDRPALYRVLDAVHRKHFITCIIQGGAKGADQFAARYGREKNIRVISFRADWSKGNEGGPIRNALMIEKGKPEAGIAFPRGDGSLGRGTRDMIRKLKRAKIPVWQPLGPFPDPAEQPKAAGRPPIYSKKWKYGAVYVVGALSEDTVIGPFKIGMIGWGQSVGRRLQELQTGSPRKLAVAHIHPANFAASTIEAMAHRFLKEHRLTGEWFDCSLALAIDAIRRGAQQEAAADRRPLLSDYDTIKTAQRYAKVRRKTAITAYRSALD